MQWSTTAIAWAQRLPARALIGLIAFTEARIRNTRDGRRPFFEPDAFPWVASLEAGWRGVRDELDGVLARLELLPNFQDIQVEQRMVTNDDGWKTFIFLGYGARHEQNLARCPETARLLAAIPGLTTAFFSILRPGKRLPPHHGPYAGVLRYHLALKVPEPAERCGLRVGGVTAHWREGRSLVFDDTHEHEAWNDTADVRVVLFVDFARPLPPLVAALNWVVLRAIRLSPFIREAVRRLQAWEELVGPQFDAAGRSEPVGADATMDEVKG